MAEGAGEKRMGRCEVKSTIHEYDDGHECRRFISLDFARALGIADPDDPLGEAIVCDR